MRRTLGAVGVTVLAAASVFVINPASATQAGGRSSQVCLDPSAFAANAKARPGAAATSDPNELTVAQAAAHDRETVAAQGLRDKFGAGTDVQAATSRTACSPTRSTC